MDGGAGLRKRNKGGASTFESTAQDDVVERVARHVRHLDVYSNNKLSPEFKVQTEMGGQISLVGWVVTLVVVGCTTAMLVGPSPEPLKNEYCKDWSP